MRPQTYFAEGSALQRTDSKSKFRQTISRLRSRAARVMLSAYHGGAHPRRDSPYSERTAIYIQIDKISFPFACSPCYAFSISRRCTPSEGFALQRTDSNLYSDRQNFVSVRVQPVLCVRAYHGGARPRRDSPYSERTVNLSSDRQYRVSVRVQPVLCFQHITGVPPPPP